MAKDRTHRPPTIKVRSEAVTESELQRRAERLLPVLVSKAVEDGADLFEVTAEVNAAAQDVYALIDWADERNKFRQLGELVTPLDGQGRSFRLVIGFMPEVTFDYEILGAEKPTHYHHQCVITPPQGHLGRSVEQFRIVALEHGKCAVTLTVAAYFDPGLGPVEQQEAIRLMTVGTHNGLAKLKAYAEFGVGTWEAFDNLQLMSV